MRRPLPLLLAGAAVTALLPLGATHAAPAPRHFTDIESIGTDDFDSTVAVDAADDLVAHAGYVKGTLEGETSAGGQDAFVQVLTTDLTPLWARQIGGPGEDSALAVATDGSRVLVGGTSEGGIGGPGLGSTDGWLRLLDSTGATVRTHLLGGEGWDGVADVALADDGYYAAGWFDGAAKVWKLRADGTVDWAVDVPGDRAAQLVVQDDQVVVASVVFWEDGDDGTTVVSLDPADGSQVWATPTSFGGVTGMSTDGENVYYTRWSVDFDDYRYIGLVTAIDAAGTRLWSFRIFEGEGFDYDARAVAWDGTSVVVVANYQLVAFSPDGQHVWDAPLPGVDPTSADAGAHGLYVGGETNTAFDGVRHDAVVARALTFQPDARARYLHDEQLVGDDRYGRRGQKLVVTVEGVKPRSVVVSAQNDGEVPQRLRVTGCAGHDGYRIRYFDSRHHEVTRAVTGRGYRTTALQPGEAADLRVVVTPRRRTTGATSCQAVVRSAEDDRDKVKLAIKRP